MNGVDLSHWNGDVNFFLLRHQNNMEFVIIKAGGSENGKYYKDPKFDDYYRMAKANGLKIGAYFFVGKGFTTKTEGKKQAEYFLSLVAGKEINFGMWLDVEAPHCSSELKTKQTTAAKEFMSIVESHHYFTGIYGSDISTFKDGLVDMEKLSHFAKWVARYGVNNGTVSKTPEYAKPYEIFQYSSHGRLSANPYHDFDMDYAFHDISQFKIP